MVYNKFSNPINMDGENNGGSPYFWKHPNLKINYPVILRMELKKKQLLIYIAMALSQGSQNAAKCVFFDQKKTAESWARQAARAEWPSEFSRIEILKINELNLVSS